MRITTKKGREFAFKLRAIRNERTGKKQWYVGITTKEYFWLDLNTSSISIARICAVNLRGRLKTEKVWIFQTTKSFWLVTKRKLFKADWNKEYRYWLMFSDNIICHAFCECCIRYHKATLRVSLKKGKRPKLIGVISRLDGESKPFTARVRDHFGLVKTQTTPNNHTKKMNINTLISWLMNMVQFNVKLGISNALNPYGLFKSHYIDKSARSPRSMQALMNVYRGILRLVRVKIGVFKLRWCKEGQTVLPFMRPHSEDRLF